MRVGASRTAPDLTITAPHRSALAPAAQPRPASPRRALPAARVSKRVPIPCKSGVPVQCSLTKGVPRYFNVWRWVQKQTQNDGHIGPVTVTEVMRYAAAPIVTLAASWRETLATWQGNFRQGTGRGQVPP